MKIAGQDNISSIQGAAQAEAAASRRAGESGSPHAAHADSDPAGSSLTLSARSEDATRIFELAQGAAEFRLDRVAAARADLASGQMAPNAIAITIKMIAEIS